MTRPVRLILLGLLGLLLAEPAQAVPPTARPSSKPTQSGRPRPNAKQLAQYDTWQREAARRHGVDWRLAAAMRIKESFNDPFYVSTVGAVGLMQLLPASHSYVTANYRSFVKARRRRSRQHGGRSAKAWGLAYQADLLQLVKRLDPAALRARDRRFDPRWNIDRGTAHLARDYARMRRRYPRASPAALREMVIAAFFAGPGRVRFRSGKVVVPTYVTPYVDDVLSVFRRICQGRPGR